MSKTIIVSNRLPVKISTVGNEFIFTPSEGGLATGLGSVYRQGNNIWIGWPGIEVGDTDDRTDVINKLNGLNLVPVFLDQEEIQGYYEGFSNEVLWPVFHYLSTYARYDYDNWLMYKMVNKKFAEVVLTYLEPDDTLWIQDYQLLLLAGLIRQVQPDATIGFFQHIPFPSQELFRLIPWRKELLNGMLGADLLGFHTFDDVRHFVSSAARLLPVQTNANMIKMDDRTVLAEPFPMGIDCQKFSALSENLRVKTLAQQIKDNYRNQKIILSIDRLDYSKGIIQRLEAYELLLRENPAYREKMILYMVVVPSRDNVPQYRDLKDEIDRLVGNINAQYRTFSWLPIAYFYHGYPIEEISALYNAADICLVTPMRDGMNLVSKEYVASRNKNDGVLILSEMAGASKELIDAIIVNPNSISAVRKAIIAAINMPLDEQEMRMKNMREVVFKFNIDHWVNLFMGRLKEVKLLQQSTKAKLVREPVLKQMIDQYPQASKRLLLFDYDGTLVGFQKQIDKASPDEALYNLLDRLQADPRNHLVIISGRKHETLEVWFGNKNYDLIAEHGAWRKSPNSSWIQRSGLTGQWKEQVRPLMETFADRTPGAFVEEKSYSLVWHFRTVQTGLGDLRANELIDNLRYYLTSNGLQLLLGDKVVEVKNAEVTKGRATLDLLHGETFDFILAIGDDVTDEDTFKALPEDSITIKVGSDVSAARYYVETYQDVRKLLIQLAST
ncbi:trehalose 6-phosphate synthase /trehalose 6-phosphatase [bacterium A37T11]|nr:trehalose 6-phosphate synthase /trehalose 6-phosphatase [bacterium A37T11]